jgi:ferredoxin
MKVSVDFDICASTGGCTHIAPQVFKLDGEGFLQILIEEPPAELHAAVTQAADMCPTAAITISE